MNTEELEHEARETKLTYEQLFVKHYFKKEYKDLTKDEKYEMDCFGLYGMTEWVQDNVSRKDSLNEMNS